ncbi:MAG: dockerin type I repeat-containing protein, partial [Armatimonadota bacterium]
MKRIGMALLLLCIAVLGQPAWAGLIGDLNGNGAVDVGDVATALRAATGLLTLSPGRIATADVTGDGVLDVRDVQILLRAVVGLTQLPGRSPTAEAAVRVSPEAVMIPPKGTYAFQAKVVGMADQSVEWSVVEGPAGGIISPEGVYTAPETPGKYHVVARSKADPSKAGEGIVDVRGAPLDAPYPTGARPSRIIVLGDPSDGGKRTPFIFSGKAVQEPIAKPLLKPTAVMDRRMSLAGKLEELELEPGAVVISSDERGFIGRVKSAAQIDDKAEIQTEPVRLDEIIETANFALVKSIRREDMEAFVPLTPGVGQPIWVEKSPQGPAKQAGDGWFSVPIDINVSDALQITGNIYWRASIDIGAYWDWWNPNHRGFWFIPDFDIQFSGTVTGTVPIANLEVSIPLYEMPLTVIWVQVGPVPVLFKPDVSVSLELSASLSAGVSVRPVASLSGQFGCRYDQDGGGFRVVHSLDSSLNLSPAQPITTFVSGDVRASLVPDLDLLVYGVVGPYVSFEVPYFNTNLTAETSPPQVTLTGRVGISGDTGLRLSLAIWSIDFSVTGFDLGWDVFTYTYPIYPSLRLVTLNPQTVVGGTSTQGGVELSGPAPAGGAVVSLRSSGPAVSVPASVTVPEGETRATFTVQTTPVTSDTSVMISSTYRDSTVNTVLTVKPPTLVSLTVTPSTAVGGTSTQGGVELSGPAPAGGA